MELGGPRRKGVLGGRGLPAPDADKWRERAERDRRRRGALAAGRVLPGW